MTEAFLAWSKLWGWEARYRARDNFLSSFELVMTHPLFKGEIVFQ